MADAHQEMVQQLQANISALSSHVHSMNARLEALERQGGGKGVQGNEL